MKILAIDVGTGTQDIFLYDSRLDLENGFKLIMPSPTLIVNRRLREATRRKEAVLLSGVTMGGGPAAWAVEAHLKAGLSVYATDEAARTLNDDLEVVKALGVQLVSPDEARRLPDGIIRLRLADFDPIALRYALAPFGLTLHGLSAVAVAVFDHGAAPAGVSDRRFRFDYLDERIRAGNR
ncbi:pyruvate formate lyase-activating protein, partial [bacterium]